jgi:hypothetical protein
MKSLYILMIMVVVGIGFAAGAPSDAIVASRSPGGNGYLALSGVNSAVFNSSEMQNVPQSWMNTKKDSQVGTLLLHTTNGIAFIDQNLSVFMGVPNTLLNWKDAAVPGLGQVR